MTTEELQDEIKELKKQKTGIKDDIAELEHKIRMIDDKIENINSDIIKIKELPIIEEYKPLLDQLKKLKYWTIKRDAIADITKPLVIIYVNDFSILAKGVVFYWKYHSASGHAKQTRRVMNFDEFQEKFEPLMYLGTFPYQSMIEEAHAYGNKLYYCKRWNSICMVKECSEGTELSDISLPNGNKESWYDVNGNKESWYDVKGMGYLGSIDDPIRITFTSGKVKERGEISNFNEGCKLKGEMLIEAAEDKS